MRVRSRPNALRHVKAPAGRVRIVTSHATDEKAAGGQAFRRRLSPAPTIRLGAREMVRPHGGAVTD
jgi:hypothetical protein